MTEDEIKYRRCSVPGCDYKELRGSRQGAFRQGKFVCDTCYTEMPDPLDQPIVNVGDELHTILNDALKR